MENNYIDIKEVDDHISSFPMGSKVKVVDEYIKELKKMKKPISFDKDLLMKSNWLERTFFFVNLSLIKDYNERLKYIDKYKEIFIGWFSTDQIIKFVKESDIDLMIKYSIKYINSKDVYTRRWGYVMYIFHSERDKLENAKKILTIIKDDEELTIQMAEGWLLCELAIFNFDLVFDFIKSSNISYKIKSWAISKIQDSYRIDEANKEKVRGLRKQLLS